MQARRVWAHRIYIESLQHEFSSFVTLTYEDGMVPVIGDMQFTLRPSDLQLWMKRYRKLVFKETGRLIRFYGVGEYGEKGKRAPWNPHYHLAVFGAAGCGCRPSIEMGPRPKCCGPRSRVSQTWPYGFNTATPLNVERSNYVARYVTKKMTRLEDPRLCIVEPRGSDPGLFRYPEFSRSSNHPGIGAIGMMSLAGALRDVFSDEPDVWKSVTYDGKKKPLGRYLVNKLREFSGRAVNCPQVLLDEIEKEMRIVYDHAVVLAQAQKISLEQAMKMLLSGLDDQRYVQMAARQKIFKPRETL